MSGALVRVAVDAALFAGACVLAVRARAAAVRRRLGHLRRSGRGVPAWRARWTAAARQRGITAEPGQLLAAWALALVAAASAGSVLSPVWSVLGASAVLVAGPVAWRWAGVRTARARSAAVPDALEHVARDLRAGATVPLAVGELATRSGPLAAELTAVRVRARFLGWPAALRSWAPAERRPGRGSGAGPAVSAAASGLAVAVDVGGPAAAALDALAGGLRDEHDRVLEAHALATQGRLSAVVVGLAPVGSVALAGALDARSGRVLVATPGGRLCLVLGLALDGLAAWWMRRIVAAVA